MIHYCSYDTWGWPLQQSESMIISYIMHLLVKPQNGPIRLQKWILIPNENIKICHLRCRMMTVRMRCLYHLSNSYYEFTMLGEFRLYLTLFLFYSLRLLRKAYDVCL